MRKFVLALGSLALAATASAQQVLQCANPDVLNSLVFNARPESKMVVKRTLPDVVAGYRAPAGFTLIGSGIRGDNASTVVAYRTALEPATALDSLLSFLSGEGWKREAPQAAPSGMMFGPQTLDASVCRDGERRSVQVREVEGIRFARIVGYQASPPRACNAPQPTNGQAMNGFGNPLAAHNAAMALMPQFSFPANAKMAAAGPDNPNTGGRGAVSTVRIESPDSAATLAGSLAQQLATQGWRRDAEWKGALSTGSTWTRKADDGNSYLGALELLGASKDTYDVAFTVSVLQ